MCCASCGRRLFVLGAPPLCQYCPRYSSPSLLRPYIYPSCGCGSFSSLCLPPHTAQPAESVPRVVRPPPAGVRPSLSACCSHLVSGLLIEFFPNFVSFGAAVCSRRSTDVLPPPVLKEVKGLRTSTSKRSQEAPWRPQHRRSQTPSAPPLCFETEHVLHHVYVWCARTTGAEHWPRHTGPGPL
jgi:hypothetical protein